MGSDTASSSASILVDTVNNSSFTYKERSVSIKFSSLTLEDHSRALFLKSLQVYNSNPSIMASYGTMQRPGTSSTSPPSTQPDDSKDSARKKRNDFQLLCPFNIPISPEAAAVRIIRNLRYFGLYYTLFVWIILFISLVPRRKVSLILLVVMTIVTSLYLTLLRALPNSVVLHRIIDKRLVLSLLAIGTAVELILTRAAIHLVVSLACGIPIVLVHAVLRVSDDLFVGEEACAAGELVPLVHGKTGDVDIESPASV